MSTKVKNPRGCKAKSGLPPKNVEPKPVSTTIQPLESESEISILERTNMGLPLMNAASLDRITTICKMCSDPSRIRMLEMCDGKRTVNELCKLGGMSQPAGSHHLSLLRHGGLIHSNRTGKSNVYALTSLGELFMTSLGEFLRILPR